MGNGNFDMQFGIKTMYNNKNIRIIARLDIKGANLIKGVHLEGLRVIGSPSEYARRYYYQGADELIYMDAVASLYGRNQLSEIISEAAKDIFIPITVGGGIRSVEDAYNILRSGADKVAINTAAIKNPELISQVANTFGSQAMVLSVEAKQFGPDKWEAFTDNGRERTNLDVLEWIKKGVMLGAGEVLLTSIDREGTRRGFDYALVKAITDEVSIPVIVSGGMGQPKDLIPILSQTNADAIAMADILHYERATINEIRETASNAGFTVRKYQYGI